MDPHWAQQHLEVIRTLMERSAVYRRALAPTTLLVGAVGTAAAALGWFLPIDSGQMFGCFWLVVAVLAAGGALFVMRRQSLRDAEPFWSPPARQVVRAMLAPLLAGGVAGALMVLSPWRNPHHAWWLPPIWIILYGCALHAAGFFMPRGIRWLGWIFVLLGCSLLAAVNCQSCVANLPDLRYAHWLMGAAFGGLHLAYGIYLRITETRKPAA
jgi:hypothetical protein